MKPAHFGLLMLVCAVWGLALPWTRVIVQDVPPVFAAALRFSGVALCLIPFLRHLPTQWPQMIAVSMCIGALHFVLLFVGLQHAPASAVAIVGQLGLPMVTALSVIFLGEVVRVRRLLGMVLAFAGVITILWKPGALAFDPALLLIVASAFCGAAGSILMKKMAPVPILSMQAWTAALSAPPLLAFSLLTETGQIAGLAGAGWLVWSGILFSIVAVSIFAHSAYYWLLKQYEVTRLAPLTLMVPVWAMVIGIFGLGEQVTPQLVLGAVLTLAGVFVVASRDNKSVPGDILARSRQQ